MEIFLIRHGESLANKVGMIQGQLNVDLSEEGFEQAKKVAQRLKDYDFDFIYSSDLRRALNTAKEINLFHNKEIIIDSNLREKTHGIEDGRLPSTASEEIWEEYRINPDFKFEKGESFNDLVKRLEIFYKSHLLNPNNQGKKILIVCHGGVIKALLTLIHNKNEITCMEELENWRTANTCLYHIDFNAKENPVIKKNNCINHLKS